MTDIDNSPDNTVPSLLLGDPAETIFHSLHRGGENSDTGRWLTSLVNDALEISAHGDSEQPVTEDDINTMVRWIAQIFNEFELYRIEFNNKTVGSDLFVNASSLNLETLSSSSDHFEGHLSTRYWSLAFDASTRQLDVYLIPAELLLAFTTSRIGDTEYKPFMTFKPRRHADQYYWQVGKQTITFEMLPQLAKELFGDLIRVASGNITEEEFFKNSPNQVVSEEKLAAEIAPTDRSYEQELEDSVLEGQTFKPERPKLKLPEIEPVQVRTAPLTDQSFAFCEKFSAAIDKEMHEIIEFAKTQPENVAMLLNCKQILTELDALRVATNRTTERLRELAAE